MVMHGAWHLHAMFSRLHSGRFFLAGTGAPKDMTGHPRLDQSQAVIVNDTGLCGRVEQH